MKKQFLTSMSAVTLTILFCSVNTDARSLEISWTKTLGGSGFDQCNAVQQTMEGGYILAGWTSVGVGEYQEDMYLVKTDARGNLQWKKTFGGPKDDCSQSVQCTKDGGYILAGYTNSAGHGDYDMYLVKTDAAGNKLWERCYGSTYYDACNSVQQTSDGGYILAGLIRPTLETPSDVLLVKTDAEGNLQWQKTYGGKGSDACYVVQTTSDGGFILGGDSDSFGSDPLNADMYLVKTDAQGNLQWEKTYGGSKSDGCYTLQQTPDGGYILGGDSDSFADNLYDMYLVKTDARGNLEWQNTFGGKEWDDCMSIAVLPTGGYLLGGYTESFGAGAFDQYLVKTDASGKLLWQKTFGGSGCDYGYSLQIISGGKFILAGCTEPEGKKCDDMLLVCGDLGTEIIPDISSNPFGLNLPVNSGLPRPAQKNSLRPEELAQRKVTFITSELTSGFYLFRLWAGKSVAGSALKVEN